MAKKKSGQKKNVPSLYMRSIGAEALEKYTQRTFVIKKDTFTKENHMAQQTSQEVRTDEKNVAKYKEQAEEKEADVAKYKEQAEEKEANVVEYKEQAKEKEADVVEYKEQTKEKEADVVEHREQTEKNIAKQVEEVQESVVSKNKEREKSGAEVQNNKHKFISFREMTNEEKVYYLLNRPHYIPKANCFFRTKRASYIGRIIAYENGRVKIKSSTKLTETVIDINEIILIQMIGT
ncbi:CotO family spore coat protein [Bacillus pseudomycoides]|uniref:CotO family spore coat protein n=1 Tax=Bacillus pseudomycoides TaxID=64104 RepID=UPI001FB334EF|nr:CotO family spore coat protein [Bacillus pseudomycoides]